MVEFNVFPSKREFVYMNIHSYVTKPKLSKYNS
jgi:hypothetical protein